VDSERKIRVAVVFGGRGPEHAISCLGAGSVLKVLDRDTYEVIPIGITRDGAWLQVTDEPERLALTDGQLPTVDAVAKPDAHVVPWGYQGDASVVASAPGAIPHILGDVDVVLPILHGPYGEDGTIQGLLELAGIRYVGAGVLASAVSMDKEYMKLVFAARGLPVGRHVVIRQRQWLMAATDEAARQDVVSRISELGWPVFVKPARGGSSIGTSRVTDPGQLGEALESAFEHDPKALVEAVVEGAEIECSVLEGLDGGPPDTSMPGQLVLGGGEEWYDFTAKYLDDGTGMTIPAPIPAEHLARIRTLAAQAFEAVSCEGLARVDFFYQPDGTVVVNEINTIPGLTGASYFAKMWEATGMQFPDLVDRLLRTALSRREGLR
jgi:D-alanine-D-alanine ligase